MLSVTVSPAWAVTPNTVATASGTAAGSPTGANSTSHTPSANSRRQLGGHLNGQTGLPDSTHPGQGHQPMGPHQLGQLLHLDLAADEARRLHRQVPRHRVQRPQRRELDPQTVGAHLEEVLDTRQVAQPVFAQIDQIDPDTSAAVDAATRIWPP